MLKLYSSPYKLKKKWETLYVSTNEHTPFQAYMANVCYYKVYALKGARRKNIRTCRMPLINAHYMENSMHYRQKYYKPTALIDGDRLQLFYTSNAENDYRQNVLWTVNADMRELKL